MLIHARLVGLLLLAMLACATQAAAATPVSDQYQSAPAPDVSSRDPAAAASPTATRGSGPKGAVPAASGQGVTPPAGSAPEARPGTPAAAVTPPPVEVNRPGPSATTVDAPFKSPDSSLPLFALAGLALLALGLLFAAVSRMRRPTVTS